MKSVPIPGEILRTDVFLGLTFDELVILGSVPLVVIFPSLFIKQIPLFATLGIVLLSTLGVAAIVLRTPDGQTPLEWAPAALRRRIMPDTYYLKPRIRDRDTIVYADVVHTSDQIVSDSNQSEPTDSKSNQSTPTTQDD
ncbi:hypothetical protein C440_06582 [Haloferax mucosum ATCC BAA-1512]|uniref:PrgI family protein n=1 Tax=Haloferax mucosum ATCC BAA-1512 TaxID=662479 RepID=M0IGM9_9EURY|nr:hypothetical protein C440_06582 [Haloferax mucosum ATCC BAA-1512]